MTKVLLNSFLAIVEVSNLLILLLRISFSRILRIDGLFTGSLINMSAMISFSSFE